MKTKKHTLKGKIKEEDEDDKKYVFKDEIEEDEALEHNDHPRDKAIQPDDQKEEETLEPRGKSLSSNPSSGSTAPSAEKPTLPCRACFIRMKNDPDYACVIKPDRPLCDYCRERRHPCMKLPHGVRTDAKRALRAHTVKARAVLIIAVQRKMLCLNTKSTFASSSGNAVVPPCPRSYQTPMTNDLRNRNVQAISAVCNEIQAVVDRTQWELGVVTERLAELEAESEQEDLSAWL
ncbi:hypothetical protein PENFLA_c012G10180 [Penicillium flavigenum]|uniref:Uncharacterized protein n=1 Tax=Penicillium flavigenum TaxID=254877 RepID=A0A1V6T9Z4_9EURO|nr:hypothetical protein PENFLA_c012G10180 [Penicillium flavigenum]